MKWLITRTLCLWFLLVLCVSIDLAIAHAQPTDKRLTRLHVTDCEAPCWLGITPGDTTVDAAMKRLIDVFSDEPGFSIDASYYPPLITLQKGEVWAPFRHSQIWIVVVPSSIDQNRVGKISINYAPASDDNPTMAELLGALGAPGGVIFVGTGPPATILLYGNSKSGLYINMSFAIGHHLEFTQPARSLTWFNDDGGVGPNGFKQYPWRGFASLHVYGVE